VKLQKYTSESFVMFALKQTELEIAPLSYFITAESSLSGFYPLSFLRLFYDALSNADFMEIMKDTGG
jgi:hypothetical protein